MPAVRIEFLLSAVVPTIHVRIERVPVVMVGMPKVCFAVVLLPAES